MKQWYALAVFLTLPMPWLLGKGDVQKEEKIALGACSGEDVSCKAEVAGAGGGVAIESCQGIGAQCEARITAVGQIMKLDATKEKVISWGKISKETKADITLPDKVGTHTLYSIIPAIGEAQGKTVRILFDNTVQRPGSRTASKTVIRIYRQFAGNTPLEWEEVGRIISPYKKLESASVLFKPDGTASWTDPRTGKLFVFALGKLKLK